ncbi:MAG: PTS sugar transporter subunit IIC, partial [Lactococcus garvieae]
ISRPTILGLLTEVAMSREIIPPFTTGIVAPWTPSPTLSSLLVEGWQTALRLLFIVIYWPFSKKNDNILLEQEAEIKNEN